MTRLLIWFTLLALFSAFLWWLLQQPKEGYSNQRMMMAQAQMERDGLEDDAVDGWEYNAGSGTGKNWVADDYEFSTKPVVDVLVKMDPADLEILKSSLI
jgi:hypothetical protein